MNDPFMREEEADALLEVFNRLVIPIEMLKMEVYSFDGDDGVSWHFNATMLRKHVQDKNLGNVGYGNVIITPEMIEATQRQGLEPYKMERVFKWLLSHSITEIEPILVCQFPDETSVVVDGTHRLALFNQIGAKSIPGIIIPKEVWEPFAANDIDTLIEKAGNMLP